MTEPRADAATTTLLLAAEAFAGLCGRIADEDWSRPGLGVWDVRALTGHTLRAVTTVAAYLGRPRPDAVACAGPGAYFAAVRDLPGADDRAVADRGQQAGAELGADPGVSVHAALERTRTALAAVAGTDPVVATVAGGMRLSDYLPTRTFELAVHSLDLAAATGLAFEPPAEVVASAVRTAADALVGIGDPVALLRHLVGRPGGGMRPLFG